MQQIIEHVMIFQICAYLLNIPPKQKHIVWSNVSSIGSDEGPMLETLDYIIRIGSTPTFLYFDLYLYSAYAAVVHYVYC